MKIIKEISTHKAVEENGVINIYMKGFTGEEVYPEGLKHSGEKMWSKEDLVKFPHFFKDELLWTIPLNEEEDLFAIFERLEENNRCNAAEAL